MKKKVYISGRISGLPREQYMRLFCIAASMLNKKGYETVNPTNVWVCRWPWLYRMMERVLGCDKSYYSTLLYDLWLLRRCDHIYKLPGWQQSRGANIESCVAYHFKIWPVQKSDGIRKIDKRLEKLIKKFESDKPVISKTS